MVVFRLFERYYIAHDALMLLTFVPCLIVFLCALCLARHRKDPARTAFSYLKAAFAFLTLFIFLDFCGYGLAFAAARIQYDLYYEVTSDVMRAIDLAQYNTFTVSRICEAITDILVFLMLLRLGTGIVMVHVGKAGKFDKITKLASYGIASVLLSIALAQFGLRLHFYNEVFAKNGSSTYSATNKLIDQFNASRHLDFSFRVLVFVLAIAIVAQSVMVKMQTRSETRLSLSSNIFIASAALWLLRTVYEMASMASALNLSDVRRDPYYKSYYDVLDVIFGVWPLFILLCLVFTLGSKKNNGLWSTEQPFMADGSGDQVTPWGYTYNSQTIAPPMVHQQQQSPPMRHELIQPVPPPQNQQGTYYAPPNQYISPSQHQNYPQYAHQQPQQQQQYQPQYQQQQQHYPPQSPVSQTRSPPPHEDAMGLNHQADGTPPQTIPQPYYEKA